MLQRMRKKRNCFELSYSEKYIYDDTKIFMVSLWGTYSYFNN